ncbi:unnamed protein product, partial [Ilex paraguariensis]
VPLVFTSSLFVNKEARILVLGLDNARKNHYALPASDGRSCLHYSKLVNNLSVIVRFGPMEALSNVADIGFYYVAKKLIDIMPRILQLMHLHCHQQILQDP